MLRRLWERVSKVDEAIARSFVADTFVWKGLDIL